MLTLKDTPLCTVQSMSLIEWNACSLFYTVKVKLGVNYITPRTCFNCNYPIIAVVENYPRGSINIQHLHPSVIELADPQE